MSTTVHTLLIVLVMAAVTQALRFLPFLAFSKNTPPLVLYLGRVLPYSIMGMLVVYCLRNTSLSAPGHGLPELISVLLAAGLHKWKHSMLLTILVSTVCYMLLIQKVFV